MMHFLKAHLWIFIADTQILFTHHSVTVEMSLTTLEDIFSEALPS